MKKSLTAVGILIISTTFLSATAAANCVKTSDTEIALLFDKWNQALQSGDSKRVSETYLSDAVLLPTASNKVRLTDKERIDYFDYFLQKKPVGKIDSRTIRVGCNKAVDAGTYTFTFADDSTISARYTFTYNWDGKAWKISTHHSSAMPES